MFPRSIVAFFLLVVFPIVNVCAQEELPYAISEWSVSFESSYFLSPWKDFNDYYRGVQARLAADPDVSNLRLHVESVKTMVEWTARISYRFSENAGVSAFAGYSGREAGVQGHFQWRQASGLDHARDFWLEVVTVGLGYSLNLRLSGGIRGFLGADLGLSKGMLDVTFVGRQTVDSQSGNLDRYFARLRDDAILVAPRIGVEYQIAPSIHVEAVLTYRFLTFQKLAGTGTTKISSYSGGTSSWSEGNAPVALVGGGDYWGPQFDTGRQSYVIASMEGFVLYGKTPSAPFDMSAPGISVSILWVL